jgi:hypothetical protein
MVTLLESAYVQSMLATCGISFSPSTVIVPVVGIAASLWVYAGLDPEIGYKRARASPKVEVASIERLWSRFLNSRMTFIDVGSPQTLRWRESPRRLSTNPDCHSVHPDTLEGAKDLSCGMGKGEITEYSNTLVWVRVSTT